MLFSVGTEKQLVLSLHVRTYGDTFPTGFSPSSSQCLQFTYYLVGNSSVKKSQPLWTAIKTTWPMSNIVMTKVKMFKIQHR